jgi:2-keto-4-pentenoate hydratase/2-oxohepta-3-ene-1,7-dioic acid hydratase in catechol pathway
MRIAVGIWEDSPKLVSCRDGHWIDLCATDPTLPNSLDRLLSSASTEISERLREAHLAGPKVLTAPSSWLPPIQHPSKILCVGKNYADHAKEMASEVPTEPVIFNKLTSSLIGHETPICLPPQSQQVDYEAELVVVIGKGGKNIPASQAIGHIAGYTCGHDVSARDWQLTKPAHQWLLGKSFDTFAPLGPWLVTADELPEPGRLDISLRLNGQSMQASNTAVLIYPIPFLIEYVSHVCTLHPGDLLFTGTPSGVGVARTPQVFLHPGDVVEVEIEGIGVLRNRVE